MGTWNTGLTASDSFMDVYGRFFQLYNQGQKPTEIAQKIIQDYQDTFDDYEDGNNSWFAIALVSAPLNFGQ